MVSSDTHSMSTSLKNIKIAVLSGGIGAEREVSLQSGKNIADAVSAVGFKVIRSDITPADMSILDDASIDIFYLGLHGKFGEDGTLQKILEDKNLVFTGSGSRASAAAFDKSKSKQVWKKENIKVAGDICINSAEQVKDLAEKLAAISDKFVVKPITQGSSVGVEIISGAESAAEAAIKCFAEYGDCMVEEFVEGVEVTVGIVLGETLPVIEVRPKTKFYDYQAKYIDDATEYLFDTITDSSLVDSMNEIALKCYRSLGCRHISRVDIIVDKNNTPYVLEINTLPGFTNHSLIPMAAKKSGMDSPTLCKKIIEAAINDANKD